HLYLELTLRCNLACLHCNVGSPVVANLPEEAALQALEQFAPHGREVTFSGGEPTLVRHLPRLFDRAVDLGLDVGIITNGIRLQDHILDLLKRTSAAVCVSMDGADSLTHDRLRGLGAFAKTIATVRRLVDAGLSERMALSFTPVHGGLEQLEKMERL